MHTSLIPWLDPANLIDGFGPYALLGVAFIVFAETGLLVGFLLPGDTLLISAGVFDNLTAIQNVSIREVEVRNIQATGSRTWH